MKKLISLLLKKDRRFAPPLACILLPAVLLTACNVPLQPSQPAPPISAAADSPDQAALRALMVSQNRLDRVAAPLLVNNAELCKTHARKLLGFSAKNKYSYSAELADTVQQTFGFDERLQVTTVLAGSGAARVGVQRGDILIAAEDKAFPPGENAERQAATILAPMVRSRSSVKLTLARNNVQTALDIPLTPSCGFSIELGNADHVNAYADGRRIVITRGMLNFVQSDAELAYLLAKEMAHNVFAHAAKQRMSATMGGIIDNLIRVHPDLSSMTGMSGVRPYSAQYDVEADQLALYMVARAGYAIDAAPTFWKRLAEQHPASVLNTYTAIHPATPARLIALNKAVAEIQSKQADKRPLLP